MDTNDDKPKVRVVKARDRMKSGVIRVEGEHGTIYRGPCDRCGDVVTSKRPPAQNKELLCGDCTYVAKVGKPSTKVKRKGGKALHYFTDCDICGDRGKTPFIPKKGRPYLCDLCYAEEKKEAEAASKARREAEAEARREAAALALEEAQARGEVLEEAVEEVPRTEANPEQPSEAPEIPETRESEAAEMPADSKDEGEQPESLKPVQTFTLSCRRCRKSVTTRFKPEKGERFVCPDCYGVESAMEEKNKERPSTRTLFKLECASCGKKETLNFVPSSLNEAICEECFQKRRRS